MGKLYDSLLSGSSGKIGRVVVANLYGTEVLRKRPRRRTSEPTAKQNLVQQRMISSYDFLNPYKEIAKTYYGNRVGMKSPYNLAMTNVLKAFKLDFITMEINPVYSEIEFTKGPLMAPLPTGLTSTVASTFTIDWFDNSGGDPTREMDRLFVLFKAEDETKPILMENMATRVDATFDIPVPTAMVGKTVHVWITFISDDLTQAATSAYAGNVVIV
ncbi:MAG: DUF6266 family protein [Weeksellaceae bacterium]